MNHGALAALRKPASPARVGGLQDGLDAALYAAFRPFFFVPAIAGIAVGGYFLYRGRPLAGALAVAAGFAPLGYVVADRGLKEKSASAATPPPPAKGSTSTP